MVVGTSVVSLRNDWYHTLDTKCLMGQRLTVKYRRSQCNWLRLLH